MIGAKRCVVTLLCTHVLVDACPLESVVAFQFKAFSKINRLQSSNGCCNSWRNTFNASPKRVSPTRSLEIVHRRHSHDRTIATIQSSLKNNDQIEVDSPGVDPVFNGMTTFSLIAGQSLLVVGAVIAAQILVS